MGGWYELVRQSPARSWDHLKGPALEAMHYRIASEVLLMFLDELDRGDLAERSSGSFIWHPLADRLGPTRTQPDLEETLTKLGLSPSPSVLLVVEGATERTLMPRVLEMLNGGPVPNQLLQIVDRGGIDKNLEVFVRHSALPRISSHDDEGVHFSRVPTKILVLNDPEGRYRTPEHQERERLLLVQALERMLPPGQRTDTAREGLSTLIDIRTLNEPWEFANFTDWELAEGALKLLPQDTPASLATLAERAAAERNRPRHKKLRMENIWAPWMSGEHKTALAEVLWPTLETKVLIAIEQGATANSPVAAISTAHWVLETAIHVHRRTTGLATRDDGDC